jgi:hypothetical protein
MCHAKRLVIWVPIFILAVFPAAARAGGPAPGGSGCRAPVMCSSRLGIAITVQPGWHVLPARKSRPGWLSFYAPPNSGLDYATRLIIEPYALTSVTNDARAARLVAGKLIASERATNAQESAVFYGGHPGVLIRGLAHPGPALDIVLAHRGAVYLIVAPTAGSFPDPDQQRALQSLRFIPRTGNFIYPAHG